MATDSFTDTDAVLLQNHTGEDMTWVKHGSASADAGIKTNRVFCATTSLLYSSWVPVNADYDVEGPIRSVTSAGTCGVCGRVETAANTFYTFRYNQSTTDWELYRFNAGVTSLLDNADQALVNGDIAKLEMRGDVIKGYVNGIEVVGLTDLSPLTAKGRAGVRGSGGSATAGFHMDSITMTDAPVGGGSARRLLMGVG